MKLRHSVTLATTVTPPPADFGTPTFRGSGEPILAAGSAVDDEIFPGLTTDRVLVPHQVRPTMRDSHGVATDVGVFATEAIAAGTICIVFGGFVTPGDLFRQLPPLRQHHSLQIGDDLFMACDVELHDGDLVNHSCAPSLGFVGEITLIALRDIAADEQLTFDYATCDSQPYDEFECECGTALCRTKVTGEDWMLRELQDRYRGHFSPYLQKRIDNLPS